MTQPLGVLLVEDNPRDAELLKLALEEGGYNPELLRVDTFEAMSAALDRQEWDIIVADFSMPHFSGLAALELVKNRGLDLPFLLISGTVGEEVAVTAMKAGAHDYLMKGQLTRLVPTIERELREAAHRRERQRAEAALQESERRFRAMFDQAAVGVAQSDLEGRWVLVNQRLIDLYGYTREELAGRTFAEITHPDDLEADVAQFARLLAGEIPSYALEKRFIRKDGAVVWANLTVSLVRDEAGIPQYTMAMVEDIGKRKQAEDALRYQALHDALTGLPNRVLLQERLEQAILRARRNSVPVSLLLINLDRFKEVNDTFGHAMGDQLLRALGPRLEGLLRESDTVARVADTAAVARLGGDEFAILLPDTAREGAMTVADRILRAFEQPFSMAEQTLDIGASIGIALYPEHGKSAEMLLQHADVAMYDAKNAHIGCAVYDPSHDPYTRSRIALIADLRQAIADERLQLYYQPKVDITSGRVLGAEALVRWLHPVEGFIPPPQIIELAEHTGLIKPLTRWVLLTAVRQCRAWWDAGSEITIAVNLSARILHDQQLVQLVRQVLEDVQLPSEAVTLEITETAVMHDPDHAGAVIRQLAAMGVKVSIDDFGIGYSSLRYLKEIPAAEVKIDKSFVLEMDHALGDQRIVRAAITLAHDLGLMAVAEGIESEATWNQLKRLKCDVGQGYYFARPMDAPSFVRWLAGHAPRVVPAPPCVTERSSRG